jgi:hypothetical protein
VTGRQLASRFVEERERERERERPVMQVGKEERRKEKQKLLVAD